MSVPLRTGEEQGGTKTSNTHDKLRLALRFKPQIAARNREKQIRKPADFVPLKPAEQNTRTETRNELAKMAEVGHSTIDQVSRIL